MTQVLMSRFIFGLLCVLVLSVPFLADAALLYFDPAETALYRGDSKTIALRIDTDEDECINTIDATVTYDPSIRAVDVSRGDSILNLWIEDPVIDEEEHTITFAGGVPGGYCGRVAGDPSLTNIVLELVFRSPGFSIGGGGGESTAIVQIDGSSQVLLHDGFGTRAPLRVTESKITLLTTAGSGVADDWLTRIDEDETPPAPFSIILAQDDTAFSGKYFITFNTQDKQSGIDHYEIIEEPFEEFSLFRWGAATAPWKRVQSPYVLSDQSLNSTIRVRAIDKSGLETIAVLVPDEALRSYSLERLVTIGVALVTVLMVVGLIGYALWRRKQTLIDDFEGHDKHTDDHV